jgi:SAM-dependent methyltransferase
MKKSLLIISKCIRKITVNIIIKFYHIKNIDNIKKVYDFYCNFSGFRSLAACSKHTGLSMLSCWIIKEYLYSNRKIGLYYFGKNLHPQGFMKEHIYKKSPEISKDAYILEVGPGEHPVFAYAEYKNWYAVDRYLENGCINFRELGWAQNKYPEGRIFNSGWENITESFNSDMYGKFDVVVGSHSFEHCLRPITALKEANKMLKKDGVLVLFVPDGYTYDKETKDPTHTVYLVPEMINEFFEYAGGYNNIKIETFRPNLDLVITAVKT